LHKARLSPLILACLAATWLIWGSTYLAIKFALPSFPPFWQMGSRFLVAGALLLAWTRWRRQPLPTALQWRNALIIGGLMLGSGMGCTAYSEQYVASGLVVAFIAVVPAVIALINRFFGIRPSRLELIGISVGFMGVLLLVRGAGFSASPAGLTAISIASISWSLGSVLSQRKFHLAPGAVGFASEMLAGGLLLVIASALFGETPQWPPQPVAVAAWVYLVSFGSLLAFNAYMVLLAHGNAVLASSYTFVNPVIAMLLGIALAGETVSRFEWLATGVILAGVVLLIVGRRS